MFVADLLGRNANILDYTTFVDEYNLRYCHSEFNKICNAITLPLSQLIKSMLLHLNTKSILLNLVISII